jgi:thiamine biosynthesis lipoprotein
MTNKKRLIWQIPFLIFLIAGAVYIIRQQPSLPYQKNYGEVFGTFYTVTYQSELDLQEEIEAELKKVDDALSMFNERSVISRVNRGDSVIGDSEEERMFLEVLQLAQNISHETDGYFDITVAPLVNAWGFGFRTEQSPSIDQIDSIREFVGYQLISCRTTEGGAVVTKGDPRLMLDCSAIAKGYGTDVVANLLRNKGIKDFMVEIGGEVVTCGISPSRLPWRIGVTKPVDDSLSLRNEVQTVLNVTDRAMATSGNYRNFYYKDGLKYAHTIDPRAGQPVQHSLLSVTVLADNCAIADAYATSFMVMGIDKAKELLERHPELMAYFIYSDANGDLAVWFSPSLEEYVED